MSIGFISNRIPNNNDYTNKNFDISGLNSGNIVFINAIKIYSNAIMSIIQTLEILTMIVILLFTLLG